MLAILPSLYLNSPFKEALFYTDMSLVHAWTMKKNVIDADKVQLFQIIYSLCSNYGRGQAPVCRGK